LAASLVWRIGSLVPTYNTNEAASFLMSRSLEGLFNMPLNAPFYLVVKALSFVFPNDLVATRLAAVVFGFGTLILFALLLRQWHGRRTAVIGTLLFGLSAWFLHTARFGAPEVLYFGIFALAACGFWLRQTGSRLALITSLALTALMLYVPGMVWFIVLGVIWRWKVIDRAFKKHLATVSATTLLFLGALVPLALALYKTPALIKPWVGLPADWPTPVEMGRNLLEVPYHLLVRGEATPATWLGTAPILDVFSLVMFIVGGYLYLRHGKLARTPLFLGIAVVMAALMTIGSPISFTVIIPFMYLLVAAGTSHVLGEWFKVFPRNPIARTIGTGVMYIVIGLACVYQLTHYFAGWPHAQATHDAYGITRSCPRLASCLPPPSDTIEK